MDLVNNVIVLPEDSTKSNRQHVIPLTKHVRSIIQLRFDENNARPQSNHDDKEFGKSQWVFLSSRKSSKTGLYSHIVSPHKAIKKIRAQTGIEFSPHDLRRTFATLLNERGVSNITIEKALNHAPSSIAAKSYVNNPRLSKLRKVYQELEDAILVEAGVNQAQKDLVEISKDEYEEFLKYKNTLKTPNIDTTHI